MPKSTLTHKFQTTVPKEIRNYLGLSVSDELQWEIRKGEIVVHPASVAFLKFRGIIDHGPDATEAVKAARKFRGRE